MSRPSSIPLGQPGGEGKTFQGDGADYSPLLNEEHNLSGVEGASRRTSSFQQRIPIVLTWTHLTFSVDLKHENNTTEKLTILNDVNGHCEPGTITAIMGSSGAGKTSLLNVLSGRQKGYTGDVLFNGKSSSPAMERRIAYCHQTDLFFAMLSVREHLMFQARLRMDQKLEAKVREEHVEFVMEELGLQKVATHRIGRVGHGGISGGERRRLSFASEILTDPSLLFLDEPTSGLDSHLSENIVTELRNLARSGRTIVSTIHQPSSMTFAMFDYLFLMSEGRVAYCGTLKNATTYFAGIGLECPTDLNPADFYISALSTLPPPRKEESKAKIAAMLAKWEASPQAQQILKYNEKMKQDEDLAAEANLKDFKVSRFKASNWTQFTELMKRTFMVVHRDPLLTRVVVGRSCLLALMIGAIYWQQGDNQVSIQNKEGVAFYMLMYQMITSLLAVLHNFPEELPLFLREFGSGMYKPAPYYLANVICSMPMMILGTVLFGTISWWMIDLNPEPGRYETFLVIVTLVGFAACATGDLISTAAPSVQTAAAMSPVVIMPLIIFGGFFLNVEDIPGYFRWLSVFSFLGYAYEALCVTIFEGTKLTQDAGETTNYTTGEQVLESLSFDTSAVGPDIWIIIALMTFFHLCAFACLWRKAEKSRTHNEEGGGGH